MHPLNLTVRCMAWPENGQWVAVCLDFALAAQAATAHEAQHKLNAQIEDYVREAVTIDKAHADALLARKAPLRDRLRYRFWYAIATRPRLRRTMGHLVARIGLAIRRKLAYSHLLPLRPA